MTLDEFSNEFDVYISNYSTSGMSDQDTSLVFDEYEKSVFLTKAQEEIVLGLYNGTIKVPFENTEEVRRYLANLICTEAISDSTTESGLTKYSYIYDLSLLDKPVWFITFEQVLLEDDTLECGNNRYASVVPTAQDDLFNILKNPFKGPSKDRVLRLDILSDSVEIISKYSIAEYTLRYIRKVNPIILIDLPDGLSINNITESSECELHEALHKSILDRAVQLAIISKSKK